MIDHDINIENKIFNSHPVMEIMHKELPRKAIKWIEAKTKEELIDICKLLLANLYNRLRETGLDYFMNNFDKRTL